MFRRIVAAVPGFPVRAASTAGRAARRTAVAVLSAVLVTSLTVVLPASATSAGQVQAAAQVLNWTAGNDITHYLSAPTQAVSGETTIVFENSTATGNTTGMPHTLTFDTSTPGYNHDVNLNILANPFDTNNGRHEASVTLTPGRYRYFCSIPGHGAMVGEFVVTEGGGGGDVTAPTVSAEVSGQQDANGDYVGAATVTVSAQDTGSGVDTIEYQIDDTSFLPYTGPVSVTAIGDHSVQFRATDVAGNMSTVGSVSFRIVEAGGGEDVTAPTVSAEVSGQQDANGNYIGTATVTVSALDTESGVDTVEYSLDGAAFVPYTAPVVVDQPGQHMLHYRATDLAGNTSPEGMTSFTVVEPPAEDTTPPTVSAIVSGDQDPDGNYLEYAMVTLTAQDAQSGVATVEYSLNGGPFVAYSQPLMVNTPGAHMLHYRATDVAGNTSPEGMASFTVVEPPVADTTPPTVSAIVSGERDPNGNHVGTATVTVSAQDTGSGVDTIEYSLDGAAFVPYTAPVVVDQPGQHMLHYRATDLAGNTSPESMTSFTVVEPPAEDTTPPAVSAEISGQRDGAGNYIDSATITISATDTHSGVATVEYAVDGGGWTTYATPVTIGTAGPHAVRYRATDVAGNVSAERSVSFTVVEPGSDACPESDTRNTVIIDGYDTRVANVDTGNGCTINDLIDEHARYADHATFVRHVERVTDALVINDVLSLRDQGTIVRVASRSDIGK